MQPRAVKSFASRAQLRAWFEKHHSTGRELYVRTSKVAAGGHGVSYRDIVDECLCFGWIDGVRHSIDADSFSTRISPRKPESKWSAINRKRMRELMEQGVKADKKAFAYFEQQPPWYRRVSSFWVMDSPLARKPAK